MLGSIETVGVSTAGRFTCTWLVLRLPVRALTGVRPGVTLPTAELFAALVVWGLSGGHTLMQQSACGVRKLRSRGEAVFVDESAESVAARDGGG